MARLWLIWDSSWASALYTVQDSVGTVTEDPLYPASNMNDWRLGPDWRWKPLAASTFYNIWANTSARGVDTVVLAGSNLKAIQSTYRVRYNELGPGNPTNGLMPLSSPATDHHAHIYKLPADYATDHAFLNLNLDTSLSAGVVPQIGILTVGWRLELGERTNPDLDAYGLELQVEDERNAGGSFLGVNARWRRKLFSLRYLEPGAPEAFFTDTQPVGGTLPVNWQGFLDHALMGRPFWFAWNYDTAPLEVYYSRVIGHEYQSPFVAGYRRRGIVMQVEGYRGIA